MARVVEHLSVAEFLPPYTPELQPAEHLWQTVDEPIVNKHIPDLETLEAVISQRCVQLSNDPTP
jgi:transposase